MPHALRFETRHRGLLRPCAACRRAMELHAEDISEGEPGRHEVRVRCPLCGDEQRINMRPAASVTAPLASVSQLLEVHARARWLFDTSYSLSNSAVTLELEGEGRLGLRCLGCDEPFAEELVPPVGENADVRCQSCRAVTTFEQPPEWLRGQRPLVSHLLRHTPPGEPSSPRRAVAMALTAPALRRSLLLVLGLMLLALLPTIVPLAVLQLLGALDLGLAGNVALGGAAALVLVVGGRSMGKRLAVLRELRR